MPVDHIPLLWRERDDESDPSPRLSQQFPEPLLALLERLVGPEPRAVIYDLAPVLKAIVEAAPRLRQDPRWRRLNEIVTRG
jgi:hypothetical protein